MMANESKIASSLSTQATAGSLARGAGRGGRSPPLAEVAEGRVEGPGGSRSVKTARARTPDDAGRGAGRGGRSPLLAEAAESSQVSMGGEGPRRWLSKTDNKPSHKDRSHSKVHLGGQAISQAERIPRAPAPVYETVRDGNCVIIISISGMRLRVACNAGAS